MVSGARGARRFRLLHRFLIVWRFWPTANKLLNFIPFQLCARFCTPPPLLLPSTSGKSIRNLYLRRLLLISSFSVSKCECVRQQLSAAAGIDWGAESEKIGQKCENNIFGWMRGFRVIKINCMFIVCLYRDMPHMGHARTSREGSVGEVFVLFYFFILIILRMAS